jgi:hypothetical protein
MRRSLGTLTAAVITGLALALTAGCGSTSSIAADPGSNPSGPAHDPAGNPTYPPGDISGARVLPLVSLTGGGGRVQPLASPLNTPGQVAAFNRQFRAPAMRYRIRGAISRELRVPDHLIVGQVVAVGCDRPPGVDVMADQSGQVQLVPHEVASPLQECLAAVTTVAIAVLPHT